MFPQYLYWGPLEPPLIAALVVIAIGALWILRQVRMWPMTGAFLATFAGLIGIFAANGRTFVAVWDGDAISGLDYWISICASPELLVFVCFMMSDPATSPRRGVGRVIYGAGTAIVAACLVFHRRLSTGSRWRSSRALRSPVPGSRQSPPARDTSIT
ncbi:MAG: RnfABCDGE type electron transport complex subunit D, partial [Pseudonocardiaceae bacterium]